MKKPTKREKIRITTKDFWGNGWIGYMMYLANLLSKTRKKKE